MNENNVMTNKVTGTEDNGYSVGFKHGMGVGIAATCLLGLGVECVLHAIRNVKKQDEELVEWLDDLESDDLFEDDYDDDDELLDD